MLCEAAEDKPTDEQIGAVLDAFEKTAWAGLDFDRYAWTAVLHRERGGGAHVHVLAARCDLETGRSLNIAPPGWEKTFGPLRDAFNHEHGWARPDHRARARVEQPGHRAYIEAARLRAGLRLESSPRDLIRDYLLQRVEHGTVRNRHEVVDALRAQRIEIPGRTESISESPSHRHISRTAAHASQARQSDGYRLRLVGDRVSARAQALSQAEVPASGLVYRPQKLDAQLLSPCHLLAGHST